MKGTKALCLLLLLMYATFHPAYSHNSYHGPVRHCRPLLNNLVMQRQTDPNYVPSLNEEDVRPLRFQLSALKLSRSGSQGGSVVGSRTVSRSSSRAESPCRKNSFNNELPEVSPPLYFHNF